MRHKGQATQQRRVEVDKNDLICVAGFEIDAEVLHMVLDTEARVLWAFVKSPDDDRVLPCCYDETKVIWIEDTDLARGRDE